MPSKTVTLKQIFDKLVEHDAQFANIGRRFEDIDHRFENIDRTLAGHDTQFHNTAKHIFALGDSMKAEIARIDKRIAAIDTNLDKMTGDIETLAQEYHMINAGLRRVEEQIEELGRDAKVFRPDLEKLKERMSAVENRVLVLESH